MNTMRGYARDTLRENSDARFAERFAEHRDPVLTTLETACVVRTAARFRRLFLERRP